jgi:dolichol-phosphate mannosyltransferase
MKLSVVIPCFNESGNISKLKSELFPVLYRLAVAYDIELIFVDDGSTDNTLFGLCTIQQDQAGAQFPIKVEVHKKNLGLGAALRTGFTAASGDVIVTTDSDGTYAFSTIPSLLSYLNKSISIVTASPYHPHGSVVGVTGFRLILSKGASLLYRILVDWHIHTYTSLFRAYRREVITDVPFQANGFLAGTELMVKGMLKGYQVAECPATLSRRIFGVSKAKIARTITTHLLFQAGILLHRLHLVSLFMKDKKRRGKEWQPNKLPSSGNSR